ncbi:MAG: hypothetical protein FI729_00895 [SAR202 cluster bacterium]|nr:hypothetical protein [SAR202 cluster bacterium]|tara:strand:- start:297 stop:608 length:312 start_codon:yes stop_codon:yes gene_type:complete
MESNEFYKALAKLPKSYFNQEGSLVGEITGGQYRGEAVNPVTAVAYKTTGTVYGTNKRETLRAGKVLGLNTGFTSHVYDAVTSVSNRGNTQVVRGKVRSALGV